MDDRDICPVDGQTLEWHMKVYGQTTGFMPIFFGDRLGCGFISAQDRANYIQREKDQ